MNRYVERRISGITSTQQLGGALEIRVESSPFKPHMFRCDPTFRDDGGKTKTAFHPGQVWVRHSSKTEPASIDDLEAMMRVALSQLLGKLGQSILRPDFTIDQPGAPSLAVRSSEDANAIPMDFLAFRKHYRYTQASWGRNSARGRNGRRKRQRSSA